MADEHHETYSMTGAGGDSPQEGAPIAPMTPSLMGRLFVVPAIIVCVLLGAAVVVVLFGTTTIDKPVSVSVLLDRIDKSSGERTLGMLLPEAKEAWQAANELARRLSEKDKYLTRDEIEPTAQRLVSMIAVAAPAPGYAETEKGRLLAARYFFLLTALAKLESPTAVPTFQALLRDPMWETRRTAVAALAEMRAVPEARAALGDVLPLLNDPSTAVQVVACAAVAALADGGDAATRAAATKALAERLDAEREVQWNAAMTLARLGDGRGRLVLMNMLDRGYWERLELDYDESGTTVRRKLAPQEIENNLKATIEAAIGLNDAELRGLIEKLASDPAIPVRSSARSALAGRTMGRRAGGPNETNC